VSSLLLAIACSDRAENPTDTSSSPTTEVPTERPLAGGLSIDKVKLYQATESVIYDGDGDPPEGQPPIVVGRDAQIRVFVDLDEDFAVRQLTAVLTVDDEVQEDTLRVEVDSKPALFDSTFNFFVPGTSITADTKFTLQILEKEPTGLGGGDPADVEWKSRNLDLVTIDPLQVVILPVEYNGDGSGRLPDTSAGQIERIADLVRGLYPASEVIVRVDPPFAWNQPVQPFDGYAWGALLNEVVIQRQYAAEDPNTYYYGLFAPADDLFDYCQQGCILGLSYLAFSPAIPAFRASIGVGFSGDVAAETLVHEMGHAHGREHAPCGLFGQASDPEYPHDDAALGGWGWDLVTDDWFDPDVNKDMMSYCFPLWVSDYTWTALAERAEILSTPARSATSPRTTFFLDGIGGVRPGPRLDAAPMEPGLRKTLTVRDAAGSPQGTRDGTYFPLDHVPGGLVVLDEELPAGWSAGL
jgi:Peptidase M66